MTHKYCVFTQHMLQQNKTLIHTIWHYKWSSKVKKGQGRQGQRNVRGWVLGNKRVENLGKHSFNNKAENQD